MVDLERVETTATLERVFIPGVNNRVHLLWPGHSGADYPALSAMCGRAPDFGQIWFGYRTHREMALALSRKTCRACERRALAEMERELQSALDSGQGDGEDLDVTLPANS